MSTFEAIPLSTHKYVRLSYTIYMAKGNHRERKEAKKPKKVVVKTV